MTVRDTPTEQTRRMLDGYARMAEIERPERLTPDETGRALIDLLLLAEALPRRDRTQTLTAPAFPICDPGH